MLEKINEILLTDENDAPDFIKIIKEISLYFIVNNEYKVFVFTKIKNWFDHKWLNYSGNAVVYFGWGDFSGGIDSVLEDKWQDKITLPPFNPNRVIQTKAIIRKEQEIKIINPTIHKFQMSSDNLHNRMIDYSSNGLFIWYSSNSEINKKGSLMIYIVQNEEVNTFYTSIEQVDKWKISKTKGISLVELNSILQKQATN
jgi:hypothetical protein